MRLLLALFTLGMTAMLGAAALGQKPQGADPEAVVRIAGTDEMVIPASAFGTCAKTRNGIKFPDVPDVPPRMFRRPDGSLLLTASDSGNVPFQSKDGITFSRQSCASPLPSTLDPDPAKFADQGWIAGFYTANGKDVFALVHNEYHGVENIPTCKARLAAGEAIAYLICQQISIVGYVSHDAGKSFQPLPFDIPLAAPAVQLTRDNWHDFKTAGVRDPSNIVRNPADGYYYFVSLVDRAGPQVAGTCVFRSRDPLTQPWFSWNGSAFSARMGSPYAGHGQTCVPVRAPGLHLQTLTYNEVLKKFIALGQSRDGRLQAVISQDLLQWSAPITLRPSVDGDRYKPLRGDPEPTQYFSIIDPASPSRFFDTSGANPYLYYVKIPIVLGRPQWRAREVWRVRLEIGPAGKAP